MSDADERGGIGGPGPDRSPPGAPAPIPGTDPVPTRRPGTPSEGGLGLVRFLLLESLVVVLSVLVALAVDEWRDDRDRQRRAREAMEDVVEEVRMNLSELAYTDSVMSDRQRRLHAVEDSLDGTRPFAYYNRYFGGYYTPDLSRAAWERATSPTVAERVPTAFYADAFPVYRGTEVLMGLEARVQDLAFSPLVYEPASDRVAMNIARAIVQQELNWIRAFERDFRAFLEAWDYLTVPELEG